MNSNSQHNEKSDEQLTPRQLRRKEQGIKEEGHSQTQREQKIRGTVHSLKKSKKIVKIYQKPYIPFFGSPNRAIPNASLCHKPPNIKSKLEPSYYPENNF